MEQDGGAAKTRTRDFAAFEETGISSGLALALRLSQHASPRSFGEPARGWAMAIFTMRASTVGARGIFSAVAIVLGCAVSGVAAAVAPKISGSPPNVVQVNTAYRFTPVASDADTAASKLRFTIANKPAWAAFSATTGALTGTPTAVGQWANIRITVTDGTASASLPVFTLYSTKQRPPTISGTPATTVKVNTAYRFVPTASDPDTATSALRFKIANKPAWATFSATTGALTGTPTAVGTWNISLPLFGIAASATGGTTNRPPTITGTPLTSVSVGTAYSFRPTASDPEGKSLTFSITNRPSWASFNTTTGTLSGTPAASSVGTYSNIQIRASDGTASAALPAFAVTVTDVGSGSATLSWMPPTRNTDGTTLTNLAGYRIYYGTSSGALNRTVQISNAGVANYVVSNLSPATWYFSVRAYTTTGAESAGSNMASKTVR
jgi:hypothetical protein